MKKLFLIFIAISLFACKPSVEGEIKSWEQNKKNAQQLKKDYPAYAKLVDARLTEAEKLWKSAEAITDEEKKAEAMSNANSVLERGSVYQLKSMKSKISSLKSDKSKLQEQISSNPALGDRANIAIKEANDAIKTGEEALFATGALSVTDAESKIKLAASRIETAEKSMSSVLSAINKDKKEKKEQVKKQEQKEKEAKKEEQKKKEKIKCEYCGGMNKPDATKCEHCDAPIQKK